MPRIGSPITIGGGTIPQYNSDPDVGSESAWVLKLGGGGGGQPIGLLLALTYSGSAVSYQLRYRTKEGTTVGTTLA